MKELLTIHKSHQWDPVRVVWLTLIIILVERSFSSHSTISLVWKGQLLNVVEYPLSSPLACDFGHFESFFPPNSHYLEFIPQM